MHIEGTNGLSLAERRTKEERMGRFDRLQRIGLLLGAGVLAMALALINPQAPWLSSPIGAAFKLASAAAIGLIVTAVQRRTRGDRNMSSSMEQAQVLLAVSGALMMLIIGDSLARAFGLAGAASIVRFRTPVDDPRDVTVLFLLMGLGMACGLGALGVAGLGAGFLIACLWLLSRMDTPVGRSMKVALVASGPVFPSRHVEEVFARHRIALESLELTSGDSTVMRYRARLSPDDSLEHLSALLMNGGTNGIKSVTWEAAKKNG
jgi:hypothetical protein